MKSQVLSNWNMPYLSVFALLIFVTIFVFVLFMIFRKGGRNAITTAEQLPLSEAAPLNGRKNNE